jgi:Glycosyl hydrolase family 26
MDHMDGQLHDLLDAAAGEPPRQVSVEAVRRRVIRRRARHYLAGAAAVAVIAVIIPTGIGALGHTPSPSAAGQQPAVPAACACLGVFENQPGQPSPSYGPVEKFAQAVGREPDLVGYYSGWYVPFATSFADSIHRRGIIPLVEIIPADVSVSAIASGRDDGYLSAYAEAVRAYRHSVVISFGPEMNADWWSYGYTHAHAATMVAAWRHIVTLFRALGADNVTWLWAIAANGVGTGPVSAWWPGANYVTWVGIDGFYSKPSDTFASLFGPTIAQVRTITTKPILISETGVARDADQFSNILGLFNGIARYGLLGLVWLDTGPWRIEENPLAERALRAAVQGLRPQKRERRS